MVKKIICVLLVALSMVLTLTACSGNSAKPDPADDYLNDENMTVAAPQVIGTWSADMGDGTTYTWIFNGDSTYSMNIKGNKDGSEVDSTTMGTFVTEANKIILTPQETSAEAENPEQGTEEQVQTTDNPATPTEYYFEVGRAQDSDVDEMVLTNVADGTGMVYAKQK